MKLLHGAVVAMAMALAAGDAQATTSCLVQQKKDPNLVCRLGRHVPSRFYRHGVKTPADVIKMLEEKDLSIIELLAEAPLARRVFGTDAEALYEQMLAAAKARPAGLVRIGGPGGHSAEFPFMAMRDWKTKKDKLKVPQGGASAIRWGGDPKGFEAFEILFTWDKHDWKLYVPFACGNFWIEAVKHPDPPKPEVEVSSADVCLGQATPLTVQTKHAEKIELTVDGRTQTLASASAIPATLGTLPLGEHNITVKVTSKEGLSASDSARTVVKGCAPTCDVVTVTPARFRLRNTVDIGARASVHPAYGGSQSIRQIAVTVTGPSGTQMTFEGASGSKNWKPTAIGDYTVTAVATDSLGQQSAACTAAPLRVDRPAVVAFGAGFFGKERMLREEEVGARVLETGRCAALLGVKAGALFAIGEVGDFELSAGGKLNVEDSENSSIFIDAAATRFIGRGFIGGGLSAWDLTLSDTRSIGALLQGGFDLDQKGKVQFVVEGRLPFNTLDDVDNNYQFWGGIRIRPAQR